MTEWNLRINASYQCRKEFEAWARIQGLEVVPMMSMDAYYSSDTDRAWNDWQKTWKLPTQAPGGA